MQSTRAATCSRVPLCRAASRRFVPHTIRLSRLAGHSDALDQIEGAGHTCRLWSPEWPQGTRKRAPTLHRWLRSSTWPEPCQHARHWAIGQKGYVPETRPPSTRIPGWVWHLNEVLGLLLIWADVLTPDGPSTPPETQYRPEHHPAAGPSRAGLFDRFPGRSRFKRFATPPTPYDSFGGGRAGLSSLYDQDAESRG